MAEPPSSSSSESEVEENAEQFSNTFDEEDTSKLDVLQSSSSESDSDPDSHPYLSLFSVFKPGHVPGTSGSHVPISLDIHTETGLDDTDKDVSLGDTNDLSVGRGDERNEEDEERSNSAKIDETDQDIGPTCNLKSSELIEQQQHEQDSAEDIQTIVTARMYHSADSLHQITDQACVTPPPKPIFKVADNRKLIIDSKEEEEIKIRTITSNKDVCNKTQTGEDISETDLKSYIGEEICPVSQPDVADLYGAIETKANGNSLTEDVTDADESIQKPNDETFLDQGVGNDVMISRIDVIITDSMVADIPHPDDGDVGFQTSLIDIRSFEILEESDDDKEEEETFSTPTERLSDDEHDELVDHKKENLYSDGLPFDQFEKHTVQSTNNDMETFTKLKENNMEQNKDKAAEVGETDAKSTPTTDSSQFESSFIVIGKGRFNESKHEYKSISSSISESDLQKSEENIPIDTDNQGDDKSGSRLSFGDKLKMFEEVSSGQSQQKTQTNGNKENSLVSIAQVKIKNYHEDGDDVQAERFKEGRVTMDESFHENVQNISEQETTDNRFTEDITEIEVSQIQQRTKSNDVFASASQRQSLEEVVVTERETEQTSVTEDIDMTQEKGSSYSDSREISDENDDILPPVPPKSDVVLQELESMRSLNQEDYYEGTPVSSARNLDSRDQMSDTIKTEADSYSDQHTANQNQREDGQFSNYATHEPTSMPQPQVMFPGTQWGYYQPYSAGSYYDAETLERMNKFMYQQLYQQHLYYMGPMAQGNSMGQNVHSNKQEQMSGQGSTPVAAEHIGQTFPSPNTHAQDDAKQKNTSHADGPAQNQQRESVVSETQKTDASQLRQKSSERPHLGNEDTDQKQFRKLPTSDTDSSTGKEIKGKQVEPKVYQRTKQTVPPVPKPRRSVERKKTPHQSLPHAEKNIAPPKDTGIAQPRKVSERKNTRSMSPDAGFEKKTVVTQKTTAKPIFGMQKTKIYPVPSGALQAKSKGSMQKPKQKATREGPHTRSSPINEDKLTVAKEEKEQEKSKEDTLIFVKNISQNSSVENLENFLEGGAGKNAELKPNTSIYSRDHTEALITFSGKPDMAELNKRCNQRTLDSNNLRICEVPAPASIAVSSDDDIKSMEAVMLYFELPKSGGGEFATEEVLESSDASCKIIQFKSSEVVKKVCSGDYHHVVSGATLKVSPYYRCELGEIWDTELHKIPLPEEFTVPLPRNKIQFLSRQCCQELKEDISNKYADMEFTDNEVTLKCKLTQRTPHCRSLAKTWTKDVNEAFDSFVTKLSEKTLTVKNHVWEGVSGFLEKGELDKDTLLIEQQVDQCHIFLYGIKADVDEAHNRLTDVMKEVDRKVRRTSKQITLHSAARVRLLDAMRTLDNIESKFNDMKIEIDGKTVILDGVPEDITDAELKVREANNDIISKKVPHDFTNLLTNFLNQQHSKVIELIMEELNAKQITAEFEITKKECKIFVPPERNCEDAQNIIFELIREENLPLQKESLPLLQEQKWDELNEDITERFENTAVVDVNETEDVIIIFGYKKDVLHAKGQLERFFEEYTIITENFPWDQLARKFTDRFNRREVTAIQDKFAEHSVTIKLTDNVVVITATKKGITLAKQEMKKLLAKICHKDHVCKKVGVTEVLNNMYLQGQLDDIEKKTKCLIETHMSAGMHTVHYDYHQEADAGAALQESDDEPDEEKFSSLVDEPPGFKTKNGIKILLVKGELGKQEGSIIVCSTSPKLQLGSGAAGKSLLKEGGPTLQDECNELIQSNGEIKHGQLVKIGGGRLECNKVYLSSLPTWKDDCSSIQILEKLVADSLSQASKEKHFSILFCALGTGGLKYPTEEVAELMFNQVIEFDAANPNTNLKEVKFVLYPKDFKTIEAFEREEKQQRTGGEKMNYDLKYGNVTVELVVEQLSRQKVDCILCTTNKEMNLKSSGACKALLDAGGTTLLDECKNNYQNSLPEGQVADIKGGKLACKSVFLTVLPPFAQDGEKTLKDVMTTVLKLAQGKKYKSLACIALGTGYLKYPKGDVAKSMYGAVQNFVSANPSTSLQHIKFVMHAKDRETSQAFKSYVQRTKGTKDRRSRTLQPGGHGGNVQRSSDYNATSDGCHIRHTELKVVIGDILQEKTEGIVNSVNGNFEFIGAVASGLVKKYPSLQKLSQTKFKKMKDKGITTTKHSGELNNKIVIHVAFQSTLPDWKRKMSQCLKKADKNKMRSLSFPVLGTGAGPRSFKVEEIAGCLFDAIDEFSKDRSCKHLREIRLVIFHKQAFMKDTAMRTLCMRSQEMAVKEKQASSGLWSRFVGGVKKTLASVGGDGSKHVKKEDVSSVNLKIYSDSIENISQCIAEIMSSLEQEYTDYALDAYTELIKSLSKEELNILENIPIAVDMNIDQKAGIIKIKGPKKYVSDAQTILYEHLKVHERSRQQNEESETLHHLIQWHYEEVKMEGTELVPYDKMTNLRIENAYKNKRPSIELKDNVTNNVYVVDFAKLKEYAKDDPEDETKVVRKDILKSAKMPLPPEWTAMGENENIRIEPVLQSDPKYKQLEQRLVSEVAGGQFNNRPSSVKNVKITKIDRIQNKTLYQQYAAKKELMMKQTPNPQPQFPIERSVWHGTTADCLTSIYTHGFNRSFCGKNGIWFGAGVYFAADASYSARSWLSGATASGGGASKGYIFIVKALTGEYCQGDPNMRYLPAKDPNNKTIMFDSAVDKVTNPQEFVIFHDTQAYPEYLITFNS